MNNSQNPYFWWWSYLEVSNRMDWAPRVKRDFGPYAGLPFDQWWEACKELFDDVDQMKARGEVLDEALVELIPSQDQWDVLEDEIAVRIVMSWPKKDILDAFERLLRREHKGTRGRPQLSQDADYPFAARPDTISLAMSMKVWEARKASPDKTLYEIGVEVGLCEEIPQKVQLFKATKAKPVVDKAASDVKQVVAITVSRYLKQANELIINVGQGEFPKHS